MDIVHKSHHQSQDHSEQSESVRNCLLWSLSICPVYTVYYVCNTHHTYMWSMYNLCVSVSSSKYYDDDVQTVI